MPTEQRQGNKESKCHIGFAQQPHQYRYNGSTHNGHDRVGGCSLGIVACDIGQCHQEDGREHPHSQSDR